MTALIGLSMFISIWIPVLVAVFTASDAEEKTSVRQHLKSKKTLVSAAVMLLLELTVLYAMIRGTGPIRALVGAFVGRTSYQSIAQWCLAMLLCLPLSAAVGCAARYYFSGKYRRSWHPVPARKKAIMLLTAVCAAVPMLFGVFFGLNGAKHLRIVEVCREQSTIGEQNGEGDVSYLVLKNEGALPCETKDLTVQSDDEQQTFCLTPTTISAGETAQFKAKKDRFVDIKKSGGSVLKLLSAYGEALDAVALPEMPDDSAYRLTDAGWESYSLSDNAEGMEAEVPAPTFSNPGGFYDEAFSLQLTAPAGCEIYYTLDGTIPTADSQRYTGPIRVYDRSAEPNRFRSVQNVRLDYLEHHEIGTEPVDKAFIVRAVSRDADGKQSPVMTESYFVGLPDYRDKTVMSLVSDPEDLFGDDGIYVTGADYEAWYAAKREADAAGKNYRVSEPEANFLKHGQAWERNTNVELYENGDPVLNQLAGLRIQGNTSRFAALKRFAVFSRSGYSGNRLFDAPLFDQKQTHSFCLRSGFDNAFCNEIAKDRDFAAVGSEPVSVFLNGEFWYDTYLQEKYSKTFFSETYDVAKDDVEYIAIGDWSNNSAEEKEVYNSLLDAFQKHDLSQPDEYAALSRMVDVQSYIDFACVNAYLANCDSNDRMNTCVWRTKTDEFSDYGDRRWRWALNDMDLKRDYAVELYGYRSAEINTFTQSAHEDLEKYPPLLSGGTIWEALKANPIFRQQFVLTFMDLVNTTFEVNHVTQLLEAWGKDISYDDYFYRDRAGYITRYMEEELDLSGTQETLTITTDTPEFGTVQLNTITPDLSGGAWSGRYYTDYPVTLTAVPAEGHTFVAWEVNGNRITDPMIEAEILKGGSAVHVIFQ